MSDHWLSVKQIAGHLAGWAVRQSPYAVPDNLAVVLAAFDERWVHRDQSGFSSWPDMVVFEQCLREALDKIPEYRAWNERKNGNQAPHKFVTRYDRPGDPDDDFIDLDALVRNVSLSCWRDE